MPTALLRLMLMALMDVIEEGPGVKAFVRMWLRNNCELRCMCHFSADTCAHGLHVSRCVILAAHSQDFCKISRLAP